MKRFMVEQLGYVQVEAGRRFLVEVPDEFTEEDAEELVGQGPHEDEADWSDDAGRIWIGFEVEIEETEVFAPDDMLVPPSVKGLKVVKLSDENKN